MYFLLFAPNNSPATPRSCMCHGCVSVCKKGRKTKISKIQKQHSHSFVVKLSPKSGVNLPCHGWLFMRPATTPTSCTITTSWTPPQAHPLTLTKTHSYSNCWLHICFFPNSSLWVSFWMPQNGRKKSANCFLSDCRLIKIKLVSLNAFICSM